MGFSALEVIFYSEMRYINLRFTYLLYFYILTLLLLHYLLTIPTGPTYLCKKLKQKKTVTWCYVQAR